MTSPVSAETRRAIIAAFVPGARRNQIAREHGVSGSFVTKLAQAEGFEFDTSLTELAVAIAQMDAKAKRAEVARKFLQRADEALEKMDAPHEYFNWNKDGKFDRQVIDQPTPADQRQYMTIAAIGVQRHAELERMDATAPVEEAKSVVGSLFESIRKAVEAGEAAIGQTQMQDSEGQNAD